MLEYRKLSEEEAAEAVALLSEWHIVNGELSRTFGFASYLAGANFARAAADVAEALNHHPDILIKWGKVHVSVHTHDVGGLSPYDFELARRLESLFSSK